MEKISSLRRRIDEIDEIILRFLKERVEICEIIGRIKQQHGIPIKNREREDEIFRRVGRRASELGLNSRHVVAVYKEIISVSVHAQENPKTKKNNSSLD